MKGLSSRRMMKSSRHWDHFSRFFSQSLLLAAIFNWRYRWSPARFDNPEYYQLKYHLQDSLCVTLLIAHLVSHHNEIPTTNMLVVSSHDAKATTLEWWHSSEHVIICKFFQTQGLNLQQGNMPRGGTQVY